MAREKRPTSGPKNDVIDLEKVNDSSVNESTLKGRDEEIELERAIDLTGFGRFHAGLIILTGLSHISTTQEMMSVSFILPSAQCDLELTTNQKGYLSGVTLIGMVMSAHAWGFCADRFGRRKVLMISTFGSWTFSFASSFSPTAEILIILRFLTGLFLCGTSSTIYAYISEFLPPSNRAKIMTWTCGSIAGAYLMIPGVAWLLLPVEINLDLGFIIYKSWRIYIVIMGSLAIAQFLAFLYFPETPKFLMSVGRKKEALEVLRYIYALNSGNSGDNYSVKDLKFEITGSEEENNETSSTSYVPAKISLTPQGLAKVMWRQTAPLFRKPYGLKSLLFCTLQFGIYMSSGGMYLWIPNLLNMMTTTSLENLNEETKPPATICEFVSHHKNATSYYSAESSTAIECKNIIREEVYMGTLVIAAFYFVTFTTYGGFVSMFGKRNVLVSALALSGIACIVSYFVRDEITVTLLLAGYVVLSGTCISVVSAAVVDSYPTHLRAMAVSLALTCGRLGSGVAGNVVGILIESYCDLAIIGMGCMTFGCGLLCFLLRK